MVSIPKKKTPSASRKYSDEIAYSTADLDDGFEAKLLKLDQIRSGVPVFEHFFVEAEASSSTLSGGAVVQACSGCSGGDDVGYIGNNSGILVMNPSVVTGGSYTLKIAYVNGGSSAVPSAN